MALFSLFAGKPILLAASKNASPYVLQGLATAYTELSNVIFGENRQWGFTYPGTADFALEVDSIAEIGIQRSANVPQHFVESGQLLQYNKIRLPLQVEVEAYIAGLATSWKAGNSTGRYNALEWLERNLNETTTFDIVMPERKYSNFTLTRYSVRRDTRSGPGMIIARCEFTEVLNMEELYAKTQDQAGQGTANAASTNDVPTAPTASVQATKK